MTPSNGPSAEASTSDETIASLTDTILAGAEAVNEMTAQIDTYARAHQALRELVTQWEQWARAGRRGAQVYRECAAAARAAIAPAAAQCSPALPSQRAGDGRSPR
jgi:hypothetical protein